MRKTTFLIVMLLSLFSSAQKIETKIDTAFIVIGEPITYSIIVPIKGVKKIEFPILKDTLNQSIEILNQQTDTILLPNRGSIIKVLELTSFTPGKYTIQPLVVVVNKDTIYTKSFDITVSDVNLDKNLNQVYDIKSLMDEKYTLKDYWDKYWIYVVIISVILIVLIVVLVLFLKDKSLYLKKTPFKTPYEEAKLELKAIDEKKYLEKENYKGFYSDLSDLLRNYIGKVYQFSALELLSDETIEVLKNKNVLETKDLQELEIFLADSDLVKFAKADLIKEKHLKYRKWTEELIEKTKTFDPTLNETDIDKNNN